MSRRRRHALTVLAAAAWLAASPARAQAPQGLDRLSHILVLYMENRSFDSMFGDFPGANGIAQAGDAAVQRDREGKPYAVLPGCSMASMILSTALASRPE